MAVNSRRKRRRRILALIAAAAVALVVGLVILAVVGVLWQRDIPPSAVPPSIVPPTSSAAYPHKPRPAAQDSSCPDVQLIAIPGTWESSLQDNPLNPVQFPKALLLNVTRPITEQFNSSRVETFTVPYTAQFHNPLSNHPRCGQGDDGHERQVPVDQLCAGGFLAGCGDRRRPRQRHRQWSRTGR
jgi:hypothetical protein